MISIIPRVAPTVVGTALLLSPFGPQPLLAQDHPQMHHEQSAKPAKKSKVRKKPHAIRAAPTMPAMNHANTPGTDHSSHEMNGFLGRYGAAREGSGTSWQPDK